MKHEADLHVECIAEEKNFTGYLNNSQSGLFTIGRDFVTTSPEMKL